MGKQNNENIDARAEQLLLLLIDRYIREGQPVASKTLVNESQLTLSSATVRNIMADLEEAGFLHSPHTSAGRVPTVQGYRFFVDTLLSVGSFTDVDVDKSLESNADKQSLVASASALLSDVTQLAGIVTLPCSKQSVLRQVEFLPLSQNRVLTILIINEQDVQNRVIHTDRAYTPSELQEAGNYLTAHFAGKEMSKIHQEILTAMREDKASMNRMAQTAIDMADKTFAKQQNSEEDYVVAGELNLLDMMEQSGVDGLRSLFDAFSRKRDMLHLLERCTNANGVQIYIGEESGYDIFGDCSVVTKPYTVDGNIIGVLGVIGPTRMNYNRAISAVDVTAKLLSAALGGDESQ